MRDDPLKAMVSKIYCVFQPNKSDRRQDMTTFLIVRMMDCLGRKEKSTVYLVPEYGFSENNPRLSEHVSRSLNWSRTGYGYDTVLIYIYYPIPIKQRTIMADHKGAKIACMETVKGK